MPDAAPAEREALPDPVRRVVVRHHAFVRCSHWANVPLLFGLIASGLAIYWAAPVFLHARDPVTGSRDYVVDLGHAISGLFGVRSGGGNWVYDHLSLGVRDLARALRLHWLLAYLFMLNGVLYAIGLARGGGWRALLPRPSDLSEAVAMLRYYAGIVPMAIQRKPWPHPEVRSKYNALQRSAYFAMPIAGLLVVLSGWAMHKPSQLGWLEWLFIDYNGARVVHFACMVLLGSFVIPHVLLAVSDGWDTVRSMVVGWSGRAKGASHE